MAYTVDEETRRFLEEQAQLGGVDPRMAVAQYEQRMAALGGEAGKAAQATQTATPYDPMELAKAGVPVGMNPMAMVRKESDVLPEDFMGANLIPETKTPTMEDVVAKPSVYHDPDAAVGGEKDDADAAAEAATAVALPPVQQYDYDTEEYIKRMSGAGVSPDILGRAGVPGTGPAAQMHDPLPGRQVDPSEGKNFRGGQQYAPNRGRGVGDAARRAKERGQTGAFTASRQIPSLEVGWDEVQKTESPMIQRLWQEQKAKELGLESEEAALAQEKGRAGILTAEADEAGIPYEQRIKRHFDALTSAHADLKERMLPDIQSQIDRRMTLMATDPEMMKLIDTPEKKKAMEAHLAQQLQNETFNKLLGAFYAMMTAQDPGSAGQVMQERERNAMFTGAGAIPGATP